MSKALIKLNSMINKYFVNFVRWLVNYLTRFIVPHQVELVFMLVYYAASLELAKGEFIEFAPLKGVCGNYKMTGNSLPTYSYLVFDKKIMQFVSVSVEVSKPERVEFKAHIQATDPIENGKELEIIRAYQEPFYLLAYHLFRYFPYPRRTGVKKEEVVNA